MQKRSEYKRKHIKRKKSNVLYILSAIITLVSLLLLFNEPLTHFIMTFNKPNELVSISNKEINKNKKNAKDKEFNFQKTSSASISSALKATFTDEKVPVLGAISIPDLAINLPILRGVSDYAILMGAGTMKKDQQMGSQNYALTSHHMINNEVLFGPLLDAENGMSVFLTDLEYVYHYEVISKDYIKATDVEVIQNQPNTNELTLITCDDTGEGRLMVKSKFIDKKNLEDEETEIVSHFYEKQNLYE